MGWKITKIVEGVEWVKLVGSGGGKSDGLPFVSIVIIIGMGVRLIKIMGVVRYFSPPPIIINGTGFIYFIF